MSTPQLTIRNLTGNLLELKALERFEAAGSRSNGWRFYSRSLATPSSSQLALKSESYNSQEVSISISPFESITTDIEINNDETLRLTFAVEGQRYRVDTPTPSKRSTVLIPLSPNPRFEITVVYLPVHSHLALYSTAKLESWMSKHRNETPLSALSIPGTHNSPTYHKALPSVRCQSVGVKFQLQNGVRFLDIRVQPESYYDVSNDKLVLVHSAFPVALTGSRYFRDLVNTILSFLDANPTETVIISVKREGIGRSTDEHLSKILFEHYTTDSTRWFTENRIPVLGEARGKIVLLRRFAIHEDLKQKNNGQGWAMDGESWPDNCADGLCTSGEIRVQDFYEVAYHENVKTKTQYCIDHLNRSAEIVCRFPADMDAATVEAAKHPFFMNFLSASNFWRANCWPEKIAAKVNPSILDYLCRKHADPNGDGESNGGKGRKVGDGSTGIVIMDWVGHDGDWDLVRCVVGMNAKLELRR